MILLCYLKRILRFMGKNLNNLIVPSHKEQCLYLKIFWHFVINSIENILGSPQQGVDWDHFLTGINFLKSFTYLVAHRYRKRKRKERKQKIVQYCMFVLRSWTIFVMRFQSLIKKTSWCLTLLKMTPSYDWKQKLTA